MLPKQCPDCGALNPFNNSQCVSCKRDMSAVLPVMTMPEDDEVPSSGYQPVLESAELSYCIGLIGFTAALELIWSVQSRPGAKRLAVARKLIHDVVEFLLRSRLGRTPTADEINFVTSVSEPGRIGEGAVRFNRLIVESSRNANAETLAEINKLRNALTTAFEEMDQTYD